MNENINLAEILKNAPADIKLYSPIYGKVRFDRLRTDNKTIEVSVDNAYKHFDYYGRAIWHNLSDVMLTGEECLLFPSKENRDWSTFEASWRHKHFEPFEKVLISRFTDDFPSKGIWVPALYGYYDKELKAHILTNGSSRDDNGIIPYESNEDKLGKSIE